MDSKLFDSELKIMEIIWSCEPVSAKQLSLIANSTIGWNKNTTYTVVKKLIEKGVIRRDEPGFMCTSLLKREDVQRAETEALIHKIYNGSKKALFSALIDDETLSEDEIDELRKMIEKR
ncbi:MAG: BlaI/MecI/CopY family transcriptional regulator [Clostridia bacterium]|jgi:predicted transcriptional regulator